MVASIDKKMREGHLRWFGHDAMFRYEQLAHWWNRVSWSKLR